MKRLIDKHLNNWNIKKNRKPLLLRGARQIGKTYAIRQLGKKFETFIELNLEFKPEFRNLFKTDLDPNRIIRDISLLTGKKITPGKTLLFFDEIQIEPQALQALRYFYELMPDLHVVAAGSLLDFTIEYIGIPVGRIESLYMYPMSFLEFLHALNEPILIETLLKHIPTTAISEIAHTKLLKLISQYLAIGGMPEIIKTWIETQDPNTCFNLQQTLVNAYRQDFGKYSKKHEIKYLDLLFDSIPLQLGRKFKYSIIEGDYRKRELAPCLDLLSTAGVTNKVFHTDAHSLPLGAQADPSDFKVIFLDVALAQSLLGLNLNNWFLNPEQEFINKGEIVEAFVGQELLTYSNPIQKHQLFYWQRNKRGSQAEIDYVTSIKENIIPLEVKSGPGNTLKSMHMFLKTHPQSPYGIKFSTQNFSTYEKIRSYPLYAIFNALNGENTAYFE